ncbi:CBS domain containing-hemolysin-like protein [Evansella vedderi]|uniref:CBS domain containing-hemolysin-like protein n=1 Tax=Evansella vedderi TaxID=38282 RepID=A0ABT9ZXV5_9BACI|nr:hemolysin family protein [Evansella vedderi]MDQ0256071.1 CBS domain containing-hemolysin-like protein [Evansella vedderi]
MADIPLNLIAVFMLLMVMSAFFSSAETAYSSANRIRVKTMSEEGHQGAKRTLHILDNFDQALSTILVGNNLVNIAAATISAQVTTAIWGPNLGVFISTFVVTLLVLIFGEILPKSYAKEFAETFSAKISGILLLLMKVLAPVTWLFIQLKRTVSKLIKKEAFHPSVTEEELKVLIDISEEEGVIDESEKEMVHRSLEFNDIVVQEIFKPRTDMVAIDINDSIDNIKNIFIRERFSRIPVYDGNIDNIVGILSERDFLTAYIQQYEEMEIKSLLRKPVFVVESMRVHTLLPQLQKNKGHMAIVLDEYGGTSGLVTLEDILEEIVGDILDEHDDDIHLLKEIDPSTFIYHADYPLDDFVRQMKVELPDTTYHTLGGWLSDVFQRIPAVGENFSYEHLNLEITESDQRRIRSVKVTTPNQQSNI